MLNIFKNKNFIFSTLLFLLTLEILKYSFNNKKFIFNTKFNNGINNLKYLFENNIRILLNNYSKNNVKDDLYYIKNYKGGKLEPEWEWAKDISVVYTWVDGSDINFKELKAKYNGGRNDVGSRFRSADELQYSLRSLEKYMPWHQGTIYILTCQQIPKWLNIENPRVKVVYHKDIFPEHVYPTFDSDTIELFLDKIPGITEYFIYLNDDFFLNNYIHPCYFFTKDGFYPKVYKNNYLMNLSENTINDYINEQTELFKVMSYNTKELIKKYLDSNYEYYHLHHYGYVFYRDMMEPFRKLFDKDLKCLYFDKFRNWYKPQTIYLYFAFLEYIVQNDINYIEVKGDGEAQNFKYKLPSNRSIQKYSVKVIPNSIGREFILYGRISNDSHENKERFNYINSHPEILFYNFNDEYDSDKVLREFTNFMINKYPSPSSFEKKEYNELEDNYNEKIKTIEKFKNDLKKSLKKNYNKKKLFIYEEKMNIFNSIIKEYKSELTNKYLENKDTLTTINEDFSKEEGEEFRTIFSYNGEELDKSWNWVKDISIVYLLNNSTIYSDQTKLSTILELIYSLRSIDTYLPWFNGNIYILCYKEISSELSLWINSHRKLNIVYVEDIVPDEIPHDQKANIAELYFDKIPGLSEMFIYLKSNHFFLDYIHPRFFFSKEFYPKYHLKKLLSKKEIKKIETNDEKFYKTYDIIMKYFGKTYVNNYRYLENGPFVLYRDLFEPTRQLYKKHIYDELYTINNKAINLLPLYLIITYNIYGTNQPFYPNYVSGYGLIRNETLPILNKDRTIDYYGYDITSLNIVKRSMKTDIVLENNLKKNKKYINKLRKYKNLFVSFKLTNEQDAINVNDLLSTVFENKSKYENRRFI